MQSQALELSDRNIFITGGTGFLGRTILDYLSEVAPRMVRPFGVTVMSRTPDRFLTSWPNYSQQRWLKVKVGDLKCFPPPEEGVTDVIHAAATTHNVPDPAEWIEQIVGGTRAALKWANLSGARRFLFISSGAIYGPQPQDVKFLPEEFVGASTPPTLMSVYGESKRVAEDLCKEVAGNGSIEAVIARCFSFVGPHVPLDGPYAIGNFIRDALTHDAIRVRGGGRQIRSYLYGRDLAQWLLALLLRGRSGEPYNVGSDVAVSLSELAHTVAAVLSPGKRVIIDDVMMESGVGTIYVPNIAKARALGLTIETSLVDAIRLSAEAEQTLGRLAESLTTARKLTLQSR